MRDAGSARAWVLAFIAFAGIGLGGLIGVGCALNANTCPFRKSAPLTTLDGATIWLARCAFCHGRTGEGDRGPSLVTGRLATLSAEELRATIARGKPLGGMPAFKRELTPAQITAVAGYIATDLRGASPAPSPS
jgi:mono/diheme cytochrome c family protein